MIKLILNLDSPSQSTHCFNKSAISIGSGVLPETDLALPHDNLQPEHVKIMESGDRFVVFNLVNDPFLTLNGAPFAKKVIKNGDLLIIGETTLLFEGVFTHPTTETRQFWIESEEQLQDLLEKAFSAHQSKQLSDTSANELQLFAEMEQLAEKEQRLEWDQDFERDPDVQSLLQEIKGAKAQVKSSPLHQPGQPSQAMKPPIYPLHPSPRPSLKDFDLNDYTEDTDSRRKEEENLQPPKERVWNWKLITSLISTLVLLGLLLALFFYFSTKAKNREEELKVAEALSNISMALTYAQFNHIQPRNQNWTDPEFLKNNLISVLASEFAPTTTLDMQGLFSKSNYILRIYNSNNLSHYVIIAQPAPSISQWVLPRASIVIDSNAMELRKITDLKSINRLMLNPNPLDGSGTNEVGQLIKQGQLMPLSFLASKIHRQGFNPPKALALLRPGAENLIYNAPRYYRFGEQFLKKAMAVTALASSDEVDLLQQQISALSQFSNIVLYSSQGMQWTVRAQKMLNSLMPSNKLLLAYLKLNSSGLVSSSHLLMDEKKPFANEEQIQIKKTETPSLPNPEEIAAELVAIEASYSPATLEEKHLETQVNLAADSLLQQLTDLKYAEEKNRKEMENEWINLLQDPSSKEALAVIERLERLLRKHEHTYSYEPSKLRKQQAALQFLAKFQQLIAQQQLYLKNKREDRIALLTRTYQEHVSSEHAPMSTDQFIYYVKAAGL